MSVLKPTKDYPRDGEWVICTSSISLASVPNGVDEEQLINVDSKKLREDGNLVVCGSLRGAN